MKKCVSSPPSRPKRSLNGASAGSSTVRRTSALPVYAYQSGSSEACSYGCRKRPLANQRGGGAAKSGSTGPTTTSASVRDCARSSSASQAGSAHSSSSTKATKSTAPARRTAALRAAEMLRRGSTAYSIAQGKPSSPSTTARADPAASLSTTTTRRPASAGSSEARLESRRRRPSCRACVATQSATVTSASLLRCDGSGG